MPQRPDVPISARMQDCILRLAIENEDFLRLVRPILGPELLTSRIPAELYQLCVNYYDTFNRSPGDHFHDEVVRFLMQKPEGEHNYYVEYIEKIRSMAKPDIDYVMERINEFVRTREFEQAAIRFAELTAEGELAQAEATMLTALRSGVSRTEIGLDYLHSKSPLRNDPDRWKHLMKTGIKPLDAAIGGFKRKQLLCWMGGYKGKKSWAMCHTGVTALIHGLTVVHVSHEMTMEEVETRYDMMLGSLSSEKEPKIVNATVWDDEKHRFEELELVASGTIHDMKRVNKARARARRFGGKLIIKKYPMGSVNMREVDAYLQHLEMEGIVADVLINDYADIMAPLSDKQELRHQINDNYIYHKKLADERNMLVVTATQIPDSAMRKPRISIRDFAEDRRKAGNVDIALGICQTEEQEEERISTIIVVANRSGPQGAKILVGSVVDMGQMVLWATKVTKKEGKKDG